MVFVDYSKDEAADLAGLFIHNFRSTFGQSKVGVSLLSNEVSLSHCTIESCYVNYNNLPIATWYIHKPGNLLMTINTLFQVKRELGLEEQLHNLNGLMEQIAYASSGQPVPIILSDSTSLGSGKLGNVARQLDYFDINENDIALATQQLQSLSILGLPMVGVKFMNKINSDVQFGRDALYFGMYQSALNVLDFYGIAKRYLTPTEIVEFNQLLRIKYVLLAYTRTQVFKQTNFGTPFIRPLFFDFPNADIANSITTQFMYGPSVISTPGADYSSYAFPASNWCTVRGKLDGGFDTDFVCFEKDPPAKITTRQNVFLHQGTITPLYRFNISNVSTSTEHFSNANDLLNSINYSLDLHVFNNNMTN